MCAGAVLINFSVSLYCLDGPEPMLVFLLGWLGWPTPPTLLVVERLVSYPSLCLLIFPGGRQVGRSRLKVLVSKSFGVKKLR